LRPGILQVAAVCPEPGSSNPAADGPGSGEERHEYGPALRHAEVQGRTGTDMPRISTPPGGTPPRHGVVARGVAARRAELDELEEQLLKQLDEVRAERDELAAAMRVLARMEAQLAAEKADAPAPAPATAQVAGRGVLLVPAREAGVTESELPPDYQKILGIVRRAGGPAKTKDVGLELGIDARVRGRLEPLRGKLTKLADRGWLRKLPDGSFAARP
jgi:hypothetical protein